MNIKSISLRYYKWGFLILFFMTTLRYPADLDLGWHLRYGQYFFQTGHILKDNILSFVWPNFKWVETSWGFDLIAYQIYSHLGLFGISLAGYIITFGTFLLVVNPIKRFTLPILFLLSVLFITQTGPLYGSALRAQSLSAPLFATMLIILSNSFRKDRDSRLLFLLPLLILAWEIVHGSFLLGLLFLAVFWFGQGILLIFKQAQTTLTFKKWGTFALSIFLACIAPLLNPWGMRIYTESLNHSTNTNLIEISEWMPLNFLSIEGLSAMLTIIIVVALVIYRKKTSDIPIILVFVVSSFLAFSAVRFLVYFGILATYYIAQSVSNIKINKLIPIGLTTIVLFFVMFEAIFRQEYFRYPDPHIINSNWSDFCHVVLAEGLVAKDCSEEVTKVMLANIPKGNGYHPYNYGGYLSWRVPQVKTFIDGRMAAWEENGQTPPIHAADQIYFEEKPITWRAFDSQYHFGWAILPTFSPAVKYFDQLTKSGMWEKRYQDKFYSYYVKK